MSSQQGMNDFDRKECMKIIYEIRKEPLAKSFNDPRLRKNYSTENTFK